MLTTALNVPITDAGTMSMGNSFRSRTMTVIVSSVWRTPMSFGFGVVGAFWAGATRESPRPWTDPG